MVWNEQLKREIPEGWEVGTIGDLGEIVSGGTPSTNNPTFWTDNGIAWITPKDLSNTTNKYIYHGEHDITNEGLCNSSARLIPPQSILLSTRAPIGYIAVAGCALCTNQGFKSIIPNKDIGSEYIYYLVQSLIPYVKTLGVGSTFAEVSKTAFASVRIALPPKPLITSFNKIVASVGENRCVCEVCLGELIKQRELLLPLLMNGQVAVK